MKYLQQIFVSWTGRNEKNSFRYYNNCGRSLHSTIYEDNKLTRIFDYDGPEVRTHISSK